MKREGKSEGVDESEQKCESMQAYCTCRQQIFARFADSSLYSESMKSVDNNEGRFLTTILQHMQSLTRAEHVKTHTIGYTSLLLDLSNPLKAKTLFSF